MKSKVRIQRKIEAIKKLTDPLEALHELADLTFEIGEEACQERAEIRALTEKNRLALIGNGDPALSIIGRLVCVEELAKDIVDIKAMLIGGLGQSQPSLRQRMDRFEEYAARSERLQWFMITAIVGYVIAQIIMAVL